MIETKQKDGFWQAFDPDVDFGFVGVGDTEADAKMDLAYWLSETMSQEDYINWVSKNNIVDA